MKTTEEEVIELKAIISLLINCIELNNGICLPSARQLLLQYAKNNIDEHKNR